jgi:L-amino acid N-acyltransferase YncA
MHVEVCVRPARPEDAAAIAVIYAPQVLRGTASFEEIPPDSDEILRRMKHVLDLGLPYFVVEIGGEVAGYAYASRFRERAAYRITVEDSVYVSERFQRRGVARALMQRLIEICASSNYREMVAVVSDPEVNVASVELHRSLGFRDVGVLRGIGQKFGKTIDVLILQKSLARD